MGGALLGVAVAACSGGAEAVDPPALVTAEQTVLTQCPYLDPASTQFYSGPPVDYARELMITDVSVVDDPCRTTWTGACGAGGTPGIWTFGELMTRISGTGSPQTLVAEWLTQWEVPIVVNGFPVPPRPGIRPRIIDPWLVASGCSAGDPIVGPGACALDLQVAPFRLLAIANRTDLECTNYPAPGAGEARFVFGFLDAAGRPLGATAIFEFTLPPLRQSVPYTTNDWQADWHVLSTLPLGSPTYLATLESLLNDITAVGAMPGGPNNGTSLGQVRTNEIAFGGSPWKLRESRLQLASGGPTAMLLLPDTTAGTPADPLNHAGPLNAHLSANAAGLLAFTAPPVPAPWIGGESSAPLPGPTPWWDHAPTSPLPWLARHHFGFSTCNGCHLQETGTPFLHVGVRPAGSPAPLSPFLSTPVVSAGGGIPSAAHAVIDPATGNGVKYNEPWRRTCEASRMLTGATKCWSRANGAH
jgi:hypothetical protein